MASKPRPKPKLADAERAERFIAMAKEVGASADPNDFEKAFHKVVGESSHRDKKIQHEFLTAYFF